MVLSLLEGLKNVDRISDLQKRLNALPADLEDFFQHIIEDVNPLYIQQVYQLFQLVLHREDTLSLLGLSFADEENPDFAVKADIRLLTESQIFGQDALPCHHNYTLPQLFSPLTTILVG